MEKINVAEMLKDCPTGMELDSTIVDGLYFDKVTEHNMIKCYTKQYHGSTCTCNSICFHTDGNYLNHTKAKCVIFPKGKTTWEGFQRPFKDGDVVFYDDNIAIFKEWGDETLFRTYVKLYIHRTSIDKDFPLFGKGIRKEARFATEEEKQKLFEAIKANDYRWNAETKTLEKLVEPKFKVGDKIVKRNSVRFPEKNSWIVVSINSKFYEIKLSKGIGSIGVIPIIGSIGVIPIIGSIGVIPISEQDDWELVLDIPKFKVGDTITNGDVTSVIKQITKDSYILDIKDDDICFNYVFFKDQDKWKLIPNKFDITTLVPFESKVLVRDVDHYEWEGAIFGRYDGKNFFTIGGLDWGCCIPYEGNEHLFGTTDDCNEYYKTWK